jgi:hypothetical protein
MSIELTDAHRRQLKKIGFVLRGASGTKLPTIGFYRKETKAEHGILEEMVYDINPRDEQLIYDLTREKNKMIDRKTLIELFTIFFDIEEYGTDEGLKKWANDSIEEFQDLRESEFGDIEMFGVTLLLSERENLKFDDANEIVMEYMETIEESDVDLEELYEWYGERYIPLPSEYSEPEPKPKPEQGFTTQMATDQNDLNQETDRARSNNFLKSNLLELNQNPVLKTEPLQYITQAQDLATAQRRRVEEYKYQIDEFDRAYEISQLMNEQQYLTQQIYSNMMYGIPSYQSNDITRSKEFFHK